MKNVAGLVLIVGSLIACSSDGKETTTSVATFPTSVPTAATEPPATTESTTAAEPTTTTIATMTPATKQALIDCVSAVQSTWPDYELEPGLRDTVEECRTAATRARTEGFIDIASDVQSGVADTDLAAQGFPREGFDVNLWAGLTLKALRNL